jgi:hypothetical protein
VTWVAARRLLVSPVTLWAVVLISGLFTLGYIDARLVIGGLYGEDFFPTFWQPWEALRSGVSPYPDASDPLADGSPFPYPPLAAELTLPLSWLPYGWSYTVFAAGLVLAAAVTLWALEVRRPVLWALWLLSAAVVGAAGAGNATMLVVMTVALAWRWRDRPSRAAAALAAGLVLKLFVWPVLLWLLFTRRFRAAAYGAALTVVLTLGSWAVIGFDGFLEYPKLLRNTSEALGDNGLLAYALTTKTASHEVALGTGLAVALGLLAAAFARRDDDRASMTLVIVASLYATPILWLHYFGLLVVPAALYGGWAWAAIALLWVGVLAEAGNPRPAWLILCFVVITGALAARALLDGRHAEASVSIGPPLSPTRTTDGVSA